MAGKNVGGGPSVAGGGEWLYRQEGLVLGPVPAMKLVEMLYAGAIDGRTEIARMGSSQFRPLAQEEFFRLHNAKAEAKRRVEAVAAAETASHVRKRNAKLLVVGTIALVLAAGAAYVARHFAIHNPWKNADELAFADISVDPPRITVARAHVSDEELIEYPTGRGGSRASLANTSRGGDRRGGLGRGPRLSDPTADPDGMQTAQFDQEAINSVVAAKQKGLYPCFAEEAGRTPGLAARIPLEFVIGNDGRVAKLWIDHPQFKAGPLYECLLRELQRWPFKTYEGERATVGLSFNIGKKR